MEFGVFLPISGRAAGRETLIESAHQAERLGFAAVWAADRIIIPWQIETPYPYSEGEAFIVPADRPFLEPLTCLAFLASATEQIRLGISVLVMPYRHPLYWAKIATTLDRLSEGRFILGVGVGWMAEEFEALQAPFEERGRISDEQLDILEVLFREERASFAGDHYRFQQVAFYPKPTQHPRMPLWVGGEAAVAQRRAGRYGDAWFPYFVRVTTDQLARGYAEVQRSAETAGRDPGAVRLTCCRPIVLSDTPVEQRPDRLHGTSDQLLEALKAYEDVGVEHLALQFMVPRYPDRVEQVERFGEEVLAEFT